MRNPFSVFCWLVVFVLLAFLFSGCKTIEEKRQEKVSWLVQKNFMPIDCEKLYPLKLKSDTIYVDTTYGNNIDYSARIDSLKDQIDFYLSKSQQDSVLAKLTIQECIESVKRKDSLVRKISKDFNDLKAKYKPCEPTVIREVIEKQVEDTRITAQLKNEINAKNAIIIEKDKLITEKDKKLEGKIDSWWKWVAIIEFGIILLFLLFRILINKKPI